MSTVIEGYSWCCGDNVTVYQIIPETRWTMEKIDGEAMARWVFEDLEVGAQNNPGYFKNQAFDFVIAGKDFGCGSKSVEHPIAALKSAGITLVIAESFSRYSYRNAINLGLPVITCPGITEFVARDDYLNVDLISGTVTNKTTGVICQASGLGRFAMDIIGAGGLLGYIQKKGDVPNE